MRRTRGALACVIFLCPLVSIRINAQETPNFIKPKVAGRYIAIAFNWSQQAQVSAAAGLSGGITFDVGYLTEQDGTPYEPWQVGVPVTVNDGATTETVSATGSSCMLNNSQPCTLTANFAFGHAGRLRVSSATYGLEEAIQVAHIEAGGTVVLTPDWPGTTAQIIGASGYSNVMIRDQRIGADVWYGWNGTQYVVVLAINSPSGQLGNISTTNITTAGPWVDVRSCGAKGDPRTVTANVTAGNNLITLTSGTVLLSDISRDALIEGADVANGQLLSTIAAVFPGTNTIQLNSTPTNTLSGATVLLATDDGPTINTCLSNNASKMIAFPKTQAAGQPDYFSSVTLLPQGLGQQLVGLAGAGSANTPASATIKFPKYVTGIQINPFQQSGVIRDLMLLGSEPSYSETFNAASMVLACGMGPEQSLLPSVVCANTGDGIHIKGSGVALYNVVVKDFGRYGVFLDGTGPTCNTACADNTSLYNVSVYGMRGTGIEEWGGDTNIITRVQTHGYYNQLYGLVDLSFLGDSGYGDEMHTNSQRSATTPGTVNISTITGNAAGVITATTATAHGALIGNAVTPNTTHFTQTLFVSAVADSTHLTLKAPAFAVQIGTGNGSGSGQTFNGTLANTPVATTSITINWTEVGGVNHVCTDNGSGTLSGPGNCSGTINYSTGAYSVTLNPNINTGVQAGSAVNLSYQQAIIATDNSGTLRLASVNEVYTAAGAAGGGYYVNRGGNESSVFVDPYCEGDNGGTTFFDSTEVILGGDLACGAPSKGAFWVQQVGYTGQMSQTPVNLWNGYDSGASVGITSGSTANQSFEWHYDGKTPSTAIWRLGYAPNLVGNSVFFISQGGSDPASGGLPTSFPFYYNFSNGTLELESTGSAPVTINGTANGGTGSGTGGLHVLAGNGSSTCIFCVDGGASGAVEPFTILANALATGLNINGTGSNAPHLSLFNAGSSDYEVGIAFASAQFSSIANTNDAVTRNGNGNLIFKDNNNDIEFSTGGTDTLKWAVKNAGHLYAGSDNTYDIGANSANRPRSIYVGTAVNIGGNNAAVAITSSVASRNTSLGSTTLIGSAAGGPVTVLLYTYDSATGSGCTGNTSVTWTISYTDPTNTVQTQTAVESITTNGGSTGGDKAAAQFTIDPKASTAVTYTTSYSIGANCTTGPSYAADLKAIQ